MTTGLSGVDLARQALIAAQKAAKKNGAGRAKNRRRTRPVARDGRAPLGLDAAISMMMTERGLTTPAAGVSALAHWQTILATVAPELTEHTRAVTFDADSGDRWGHPRPRGDGPALPITMPSTSSCSPGRRGWSRPVHHPLPAQYVTLVINAGGDVVTMYPH
ncbi:hypothetical protein ACIBBB_25025 [Streptomyces sp. NPDC051217]|uniref:hypothetical protein n=1 Tax=Streptomyces sp. NPDC051217 TaxID=3365644 RepID=UPI0037922EC2